MKYIRNFNESVSLDNIIELLERDCKPFLDELSKYQSGLPLRGSLEFIDDYKVYKSRKRKPRDMSYSITDRLDEMFHKKFGYNLRTEGVFTSKDKYFTESYGNSYLFFPIGEYKYFWNEDIEDLYTEIHDNFEWYYEFKEGDGVYDKFLQKLVDGYKDYNIGDAFKQEITFICDEYYLINMKYFNDIRKYIIERKKRA